MRARTALLALAILTTFAATAVGSAANLEIDDKNCSDFSTWQEAQSFFLSAGPGDPHHLDANHDGIACESLPGAPRDGGTAATSTPRPAATRRLSPTPYPTATPTPTQPETPTPTSAVRSTSTGTPSATAAPAQFLASPTATPITGAVLGSEGNITNPQPGEPRVELDPSIRPDRPPSSDTVPPNRWLIITAATEARGEMGDVVRVIEPGRWLLVVETRDGWVRIAGADESPAWLWVRHDDRVQIVVQERAASPQ